MVTIPEKFDAEDTFEAEDGRRFPYSTVGDWVALSGVSDRAVRVYLLLRMHVNRRRRDDSVWPGQRTLADMMGVKRTETIAAAIRELVELGAVEVRLVHTDRGRHNVYRAHEAPPADYDGHVSYQDYYRARDTE